MKFLILSLFILSANAFAESPCDVRPGISIGIKVVEFATGNIIHSKIPMREGTAQAILEEMNNLQDMGICSEKIVKKKCVLKFEKKRKRNLISLYRGNDLWNTWNLNSKEQAQIFVKSLQKVGLCS